jgi:hypothetical protein
LNQTNWTGFFKGFHLCMTFSAWSAANKNKLDSSRHYPFWSSFMCVWLWWQQISSALISLLQHFWIHVGTCLFMDWLLDSWCSRYVWPLCSVHLFSWGATSSSVLFATHLASLRVGRVEQKKPPLVQKCS